MHLFYQLSLKYFIIYNIVTIFQVTNSPLF